MNKKYKQDSDELSVLCYENPNLFLLHRWQKMKARNPNLSIRAFARILKLGSHTPLHLMIIGKRSISKSYVKILSEYFKLSPSEKEHFERIVVSKRFENRD